MPEGPLAPQLRFTYQDSPDGRFGWRSFGWPGAAPADKRLLCLPFSGGASSAFRPLAKALGPSWAVTAVDLPGHQMGSGHAPFSDQTEILRCLQAGLPPEALRGAIVLGCSLGGYLGLRWLSELPPDTARGLVLAGTLPYGRRAESVQLSALSGDALRDKLIELGGVPANVNARLMRMRAHVVQADLQANDAAQPPATPLTLPALVMGGAHDTYCRPEFLKDWLRWLPAARLQVMDGPHVFVTTQAEAVAAELIAFESSLPR